MVLLSLLIVSRKYGHGLRSLSRKIIMVKISNCERNLFATSFNLKSVNNNEKLEETSSSKPISYLGLGDAKTASYWRYTIKKAIKEKRDYTENKCELSDDIPAILQLKYNQSPEEISANYPDVNRVMKAKITSELNIESTDSQEVQFPFANHQESIRESNPINFESFKPLPLIEKYKKSVSNLIKHLEENSDFLKTDCEQPNNNDFTDNPDEFLDLKNELWRADYGTPDPSIKSSNVPCGGCGALLHCQDTGIPGYIPSQRFKGLSANSLRQEICQRCVFLHHYNIALKVTIHNEEYSNKILSKIKDSNSLVILLVDLTDFPCSIWPGIIQLVGSDKPIFVLGNKVDLLPRDGKAHLERIRASLEQNLIENGIEMGRNLLHLGLISAKTGYGIETLITKLQTHWANKGDVHIVGCTNVGKSTLFNSLLQSDYCKVQATDLVQRATTSVWPGTTLNLLKFPILKASGWKMHLRTLRLVSEQSSNVAEQRLRSTIYKETKNEKYATLMGKIGMTFKDSSSTNDDGPKKSFNPNDPAFKDGTFCYDTPGTIYKEQILDLLTVEELSKLHPKEMIHPRTFSLRKDQTLFIGGLARLDLMDLSEGKGINLTFFGSGHLPVHILPTREEGDLFYQQNLGTRLMRIPTGGERRLKHFPKLEGKEIEINGGLGFNESCADIVLSSTGWVSVTMKRGISCKIQVSTPEGRGIYRRIPSLLKFAVKLRGKKIHNTPGYENNLVSGLN